MSNKVQYLVSSQTVVRIAQLLDNALHVSKSVIFSLLLMSGDIEQNPGPGRYPGIQHDYQFYHIC